LASDSFKVHQVVAGGQRRHALDALEAAGLFRVDGFLFLLDGGHVDLTEVFGLVEELVQGVGRVDGVEFLGRIFSSILEDDFRATGVFWRVLESGGNGSLGVGTRKEVGHIVGLAVDDHPARVSGVVLGDSSASELAGCHCD
jgi:hypothetical protein